MKRFRLIKPYLVEKRWFLTMGVLSLLVVDLLQLYIPRIVKWAVDDVADLKATPGDLLKYAGLIVMSAGLIGAFRFSWRYCIMGTSRRVEEGITQVLFNHIQDMPASFFDKRTAGEIMAHATNDIKNIRMAMGMGVVGLTDTLVLGVATVIFMGFINIKLTFLALLPMPFIAVLTKVLSKRLFREYMSVQASFATLMESFRERFAGIKIIKSFNREGAEEARIRKESEDYIRKNMNLVKIRGIIFPMTICLTNLSLAVLVGFGGGRVILREISPGDFVAFIAYLGLLTWPVMAVGWVANMIQRGKASLDRLNDILSLPREIEAPIRPVTPDNVRGGIRMHNIFFSYDQESRPLVLKGVDFSLEPGQTLGITGPPGSGKSTLAALIPRLYDPLQGIVFLDGIDIRRMDPDFLRRSITFMPQEPFLFSGTIRENLAYGRPDGDDALFFKALTAACLDQTVAGFPGGLETIIGEKGVMLSGGQKQRLALARTFLKNSPVWILDDPISQVDMETAAAIMENMKEILQKRTVILISHRFSAFAGADLVLVMKNGKIAAKGSHDELVAAGGYYGRANAMQIAGAGGME